MSMGKQITSLHFVLFIYLFIYLFAMSFVAEPTYNSAIIVTELHWEADQLVIYKHDRGVELESQMEKQLQLT